MRRLLLVAMIVAGCGSAAAPSAVRPTVTIHPGMSPGDRVFVLPAGPYRVTWDATGCSPFAIQLMPEAGPEIDVPMTLPTGSFDVTLPAGRTYVNSGGGCNPNAGAPYLVTIAPR